MSTKTYSPFGKGLLISISVIFTGSAGRVFLKYSLTLHKGTPSGPSTSVHLQKVFACTRVKDLKYYSKEGVSVLAESIRRLTGD